MIRRRAICDALEAGSEPRRLVVRNMHRGLIESRPIAADADLKRVFVAAMLEFIDGGWRLEEFSSRCGEFHCTRGAERIAIGIETVEPLRGHGSR